MFTKDNDPKQSNTKMVLMTQPKPRQQESGQVVSILSLCMWDKQPSFLNVHLRLDVESFMFF